MKAGSDFRTRKARRFREGRKTTTQTHLFFDFFRGLRETFASFAYGCPHP